jgi:hypothetical protein
MNAAMVSLGFASLVLTAWFVFVEPIYDFALGPIAAILGLTLFFVFGRAKESGRSRWWSLIIIVPLIIMQLGIASARKERDAIFSRIETTSRECRQVTCVSMVATGVPFGTGPTRGFLIKKFGASIFVKVYAQGGQCRAIADELFGQGRIKSWPCSIEIQ